MDGPLYIGLQGLAGIQNSLHHMQRNAILFMFKFQVDLVGYISPIYHSFIARSLLIFGPRHKILLAQFGQLISYVMVFSKLFFLLTS